MFLMKPVKKTEYEETLDKFSTCHCYSRTGRKCRSALPTTSSVSSEVRQITCEVCAGVGKRKKGKYSLSEWCKEKRTACSAGSKPCSTNTETDSLPLLMEVVATLLSLQAEGLVSFLTRVTSG